MMPPALKKRFEQLLGFASNDTYRITAHENIAAAKEMVETLFHTDHLTSAEYLDLHEQIRAIRLAVNESELNRISDLIERAQA